jgi:hypothetical protein
MTFTTIQRAKAIYSTTIEVFDWHKSSECVTPYELALKQFEGCNVAGTVCIPGAGVGTYVLAAIEAGFEPANIYAVELNEGYYQLGAAIFDRFGINYVHADYLTWEPQMRFDAVIGNPPYQRSREVRNVGSPLWPDFIEKSVSLVKDGGMVSLVVPFTWMQKNARSKAWKVIRSNDLFALDPSVDWAFPGVDTGGITVISLRKQEYQGKTLLPNGLEIDIREPTPSDNKAWNKETLDFLHSREKLKLDVKTGPINPSINSESWSPVETETHCYEVFYSSAKKRRKMWCSEPIGDYGKLKLVAPTYGDIYGNIRITTVGCGRQVEYVLGEESELLKLKAKLESAESRKMCALNAYGSYHSPLTNIVK